MPRIKLAQQASSIIIKTLCISNTIKHFNSINKLIDYVNQIDTGVFIVGLDFHTGFIIKDKNGVFFMHSDYLNREGVKKEFAEKSPALNASNTFMIGNLLDNDKLIRNWILEERINIIY